MTSKSRIPARFAAAALVALAFAGSALAQEPSIVRKAHFYLQTSAAGAVAHPSAPYGFNVQASNNNMTLTLPGGATQLLTFDPGNTSYESLTVYSTKAALDAAYPNGTYTMTGTGLPTLTFNLSTELYPTATPQITNGTWNAGGLLVIDPSQSYTINVSNFTTYNSAGVAGHESLNIETNTNGFDMEIATQAVFGLTASPTPLTSVNIPANTLTNNQVFRGELQFDTLSTLNTTTGGGYVALWTNHLTFWIAALTPATPAAPVPTITTQPTNKTASLGGSATFNVSFNIGTAQNYRAVWYLNGSDLSNNNGSSKYNFNYTPTTNSITINNVTAADFGTYTVQIIDTGGMVTSSAVTLTQVASSVPAITTQPQGHNIATNSGVVFNVAATGGNLSYQWKKNGVAIGGATSAQYMIASAQPSDAGSYTVTVTNPSGSATSNGATLNVAASSDPGRLINASVRIVSGTGANVLIVGFVTGGVGTTGSKQLLIRGIGPTLTGFGVPAAMADPLLEIIPGGGTTATVSNDNWAGDATIVAKAAAIGAFALPDNASKDSALLTTLAAGVYSAKVSGVGSTSGTVLAELYDANPSVYSAASPRIINLSARATMANDNPLIAGFVVGGTTAKTLLIRAIGPYLSQYFGTAAMSDPQLELYVSQGGNNTLMLTNDNWGGSSLLTTTGNGVGAFALTDTASKDAVLLVTLDPGVYSAKVVGVNNASGITLVEVYEIP